MKDRHSLKRISSQPQQGSCASLLDALHESRRLQAVREIAKYRHLLGAAEADEIRRAIEELTRERVSMRSFWHIWQPQCAWILLLMKHARVWTQGRSITGFAKSETATEERVRKGRPLAHAATRSSDASDTPREWAPASER
jgi:hypothetical protein